MNSDDLVESLEAIQRDPYSVIRDIHALGALLDGVTQHITGQNAEITRLRAQVPEGWVVVPREPTREMIEAGILFGNSPNKAAIIYQNMLSAAPTPQKGVSDG